MIFRAVNMSSLLRVAVALGSLVASITCFGADASQAPPVSGPGEVSYSLEQCLELAMQNNRRRPASQFAVAIAEAQHRQALAGYWPQLAAKAAYRQTDEPPNFLFPANQFALPGQSLSVSAGTAVITVPAGVLGPNPVQLPVSTPAQSFQVPAQGITVPAQNIKQMDETSQIASLEAKWLLFDGGMRAGYRDQAKGLIQMMKADARRTDLEIADAVKRYYYGAVLAHQLQRLGQDTLSRMEATLSLTETLYKEGGGRVTKSDYLDNLVMVNSVRSVVAALEKNTQMAEAALANALGLSWQASVRPQDPELPLARFDTDLSALVSSAYEFSPDWSRVEAALQSLEAGVKTARSGHAPKVALTGNLHRWWNDYNAGQATEQNKKGWAVALGVELPLFDGFHTRQRVAEAKARVAKLQQEQLLLKEGIGLQIKDVFLGLIAAQKSQDATLAAMNAANENRDLNERAYQSELVDTERVIRAQLMEALMTAQHLKVRYDVLALRSQLNVVVGTEITRQLAPP